MAVRHVEGTSLEMYPRDLGQEDSPNGTDAPSKLRTGRTVVIRMASRLQECHLPEGQVGSKDHDHGATLACLGLEEAKTAKALAEEVVELQGKRLVTNGKGSTILPSRRLAFGSGHNLAVVLYYSLERLFWRVRRKAMNG
jgi:hypothetical protein